MKEIITNLECYNMSHLVSKKWINDKYYQYDSGWLTGQDFRRYTA